MKGVDYSKNKTPPDYKCSKCGATGVKLWQENRIGCCPLLCANCAAEIEKIDIADIDADGRRSSDFGSGRTDHIGDQLPAVPTENGVGFWAYTATPNEGCEWWRKLLTRVLIQKKPKKVSVKKSKKKNKKK